MVTYADAEKRPFAQQSITAVSTDGGMELFYEGAQPYADVEVDAATGDIELHHGASSSTEIPDASLGLPIADETTGIMDVSDAEALTAGLVLDYINKSTNWRMRPLAMRRADLMANTLITAAQTQCNLTPLTLLRDTTVAVQTNTYTIGIRISASDLKAPMSGGWQIHVTKIYAIATATKGTGTGYNDGEGALNDIRVIAYSVNDVMKSQRRLWTDILATGVGETYVADYDGTNAPTWGGSPLSADPGDDMLILIQNSGTSATTPTSPTLTVDGYMTQVGGSRTGVTFRECNV